MCFSFVYIIIIKLLIISFYIYLYYIRLHAATLLFNTPLEKLTQFIKTNTTPNININNNNNLNQSTNNNNNKSLSFPPLTTAETVELAKHRIA